MKLKNNIIFYGIDMGSPSKDGGFHGWRWSSHDGSLLSFERHKGWDECIGSIVKDFKTRNTEVNVAIEAPLWGLRCGTKDYWTTRFKFESNQKYEAKEHPWYVGAGSSTGFMAQQFLLELKTAIDPRNEYRASKKLNLFESYISGLKSSSGKIPKPKAFHNLKGRSSHATDAFESLVLLIHECNQDLITKLKCPISKKSVTNFPKENGIFTKTKGKAFAIGILATMDNIIQFEAGEILMTKRSYKLNK